MRSAAACWSPMIRDTSCPGRRNGVQGTVNVTLPEAITPGAQALILGAIAKGRLFVLTVSGPEGTCADKL